MSAPTCRRAGSRRGGVVRRGFAAAGVVVALGLGLTPAGADTEAGGSLVLVGQTRWVGDDDLLDLDLRVTGAVEDAHLVVRLHGAIGPDHVLGAVADTTGDAEVARSEAAIDLAEHLGASGIASIGLDTGTDGDLPMRPGSAHHLSVLLTSTDGTVLDRVDTAIIRLPDGDPSLPLLTSLVLEVTGPPPLQPDGSSTPDADTLHGLRTVVDALARHPQVTADLRLPPATIVGLVHSGDPTHPALVDDLASVLGGGVRLASGPYVTADPEAWRQAGRLDVYRDLVDHGDLALADHLGTTPDRAIARLPATGTAETLDALSLQGSQRFLVDADHLDPRPDHLDDLTQPVRLRGDAGSPFTALVVDPTLEQHLLAADGPVAATQHLLSDLAIRAWAEPRVPRLTVLAFDDPRVLDVDLLDVLLGALEAAPFLEMAPLPTAFASTATLDDAAVDEAGLWPEAVGSVATKARDRSLVEVTIDAYEAMVGDNRPEVAHLHDLLEATVATEVSVEAGEAYLRAVYDGVLDVLDAFAAPDDQNVRMTSRRATVPYTVENRLAVPVQVRLHLESDGRLDFPEGDTLDVVLQPGDNRIPIPVGAKTSGDARLQVTVRSPDAAELLQLQSSLLLVRSTQLSGVGVFLLAGGLIVLGLWWFRSARNGRDVSGSGEGADPGDHPDSGDDYDDYSAPEPREEP